MCLLQGINRLGAGPRKPGIARPVDPNRFIVQDLVPEGVENDQDYKRMVQDVRALLLVFPKKMIFAVLQRMAQSVRSVVSALGLPRKQLFAQQYLT